jgi:hypothetical protein
MGGWGNLTNREKTEVMHYLRQALGTQNWYPGPPPNPPSGHPWWKIDFVPRLAYEQSQQGNYWYENNQNWFKSNGLTFSLNYYYKTLMVVNQETIKLIAKMPDNYAAMSPAEFFAELYAVYFDLDDPERQHIPSEVIKWLNDNIGEPEFNAP